MSGAVSGNSLVLGQTEDNMIWNSERFSTERERRRTCYVLSYAAFSMSLHMAGLIKWHENFEFLFCGSKWFLVHRRNNATVQSHKTKYYCLV